MKGVYVFLFACCLSSGLAKPATVYLGYQDSLGQYSFGYSAPNSARSEIRTSNGATRGAYSYIDEAGVIQSAQYVADGENGFRVVATNLPQAPLPVQDTDEVIAARAEHLRAVEMARKAESSINEEEQKLGGRNVFLQEIKPVEKAEIKTGENIEVQVKEDKIDEIKAKSVTNEKEDSQEKSKMDENADEQKIGKDAVEVTEARASQEIISTGQIPAIPLITSHIALPQVVRQQGVPVFRVSYGSQEIEPAAAKESLNIQGSATPAGTGLKTDQEREKSIATKQAIGKDESKMPEKEIRQEETRPIIAPILPLSPSYSTVLRYAPAPALHYVTYDIL